MKKLPKAWKWIIGAWAVILLATLAFYYFTDWRYPVPEDSQIVIRLSRGGGWPFSKAYSLAIYEDGTIVYDGEMSVSAVGIRKTKIDAERVRELATRIEQEGFFELDNIYYPKVYDAGAASVYVKIGQKEKEVVYLNIRASGFGIPDNLFRIEDYIAGTVDLEHWTECDAYPRILCGASPLAPITSAFIFGMILWMVWEYIQSKKTFKGILAGFGVIIFQGLCIWITDEVSILSVPTLYLTQLLLLSLS